MPEKTIYRHLRRKAMVHTVCHTQPVNTGTPAVFGRREKGANMDYPEVYAVDFDRTLNLAQKYPELGKPNMKLIEMLIKCRAAGDKVILWTCREGQLLDDAVEYCRKYGLEFDAINDNIQENKDRWENNTRKVFADFYIDDRNLIFDGNELKIALTHPAAIWHGGPIIACVEEGENNGL